MKSPALHKALLKSQLQIVALWGYLLCNVTFYMLHRRHGLLSYRWWVNPTSIKQHFMAHLDLLFTKCIYLQNSSVHISRHHWNQFFLALFWGVLILPFISNSFSPVIEFSSSSSLHRWMNHCILHHIMFWWATDNIQPKFLHHQTKLHFISFGTQLASYSSLSACQVGVINRNTIPNEGIIKTRYLCAGLSKEHSSRLLLLLNF